MAADPETQKQEIVQFICWELNKLLPEKQNLSAETDMTTDIEVDSVTIMDLVFMLEEQYDISIPLNDLSNIYQIGELADLVVRLKKI